MPEPRQFILNWTFIDFMHVNCGSVVRGKNKITDMQNSRDP